VRTIAGEETIGMDVAQHGDEALHKRRSGPRQAAKRPYTSGERAVLVVPDGDVDAELASMGTSNRIAQDA
jgi:hypothetical protein